MPLDALASDRLDSLGRGYPRPQLRRAVWYSLNGEWEFALDPDARWSDPAAVHWASRIRVPFSPETAASGLSNTGFYRACWYRRRIVRPPLADHERLVLHFGAAFVGPLHHWHYDTFQVVWQDRILGTWLVTFILNQDGDVAKLTIPELSEFTRVAEDVGGPTD